MVHIKEVSGDVGAINEEFPRLYFSIAVTTVEPAGKAPFVLKLHTDEGYLQMQ